MNKYFSKFCFLVAMCMVFLVSACKDDNQSTNNKTADGNTGSNGSSSSKNLVEGKFTGEKTGLFYANKKTSVSASVHSSLLASQEPGDQQDPTDLPKPSETTETELVGKMEDGDAVFNLTGMYNEKDNQFSLSAGSSLVVYQIVGTLQDGKISNTKVTAKIKSGDEWTTVDLSVTVAESLSIDKPASDSQVDGLPSSLFGIWAWEDDEGYPAYYMMTSHQFFLFGFPEFPAGFLDIKKVSDKKFELIWDYYGCADDACYYWAEFFMKVWIEETKQGLEITQFFDSENTRYSKTAAFDTATANPAKVEVTLLTRP